VKTDKCRYVLGSVLNHVLLHQTIIGLEAKAALDKFNVKPDIIIGCAGGGSNLGGLIAPFMGDKIAGKSNARFIAVEPASCPSFTRGRYAYDFGDTAQTTPLIRMQTLGSGFMPSANHAGGLRYHGMNSTLSKLFQDGLLEARSEVQTDVFDAAIKFMKVEGILPAPESSHAIKAAIDEALECKKTGEKKVILFGLSGTGFFDMTAYQSYNNKTMEDRVPTDAELEKGFATILDIPQNK
ncbi:MAG: pyridoxal-phosphate dependent enzyme, partial [Treponema sp.]|nr:pyridoxal-phosphate dependent enzyme [Treponema sp.]